jgi:hypothetical protein
VRCQASCGRLIVWTPMMIRFPDGSELTAHRRDARFVPTLIRCHQADACFRGRVGEPSSAVVRQVADFEANIGRVHGGDALPRRYPAASPAI